MKKRKRSLSMSQVISGQNENVGKALSKAKSLDSWPEQILLNPERSASSSSSETTSHSSTYGAAPEKRWVRCAYAMQVRTFQGLAVAWKTSSSLEPTGKMPQVYEVELSEESTIGSAPSLHDTESLVSSSEPGQEEPGVCRQQPTVQEEAHQQSSSGAPPKWMVTCPQGLRCLACCRVFPSWRALLKHAKHGVSQGFSCRVFFEELLEKRLEPSASRRPSRAQLLNQRLLMDSHRREIRERTETCRRLKQQLKEKRKELQRARHQLMLLEREEVPYGPGQRGKRLKTHYHP